MAGETDLAAILRSLRVTQRHEPYTVATTRTPVELGGGVAAVIAEVDGDTAVVTVAEAERRGWPVGFVAAWLTIEVHTSLEAVGLTAALCAALAERDIPANVVAGYHHDHLLVPWARADEAVEAIEGLARPADEWADYAEGWDDDPAARAFAAAAYDSLVGVLADRGLPLAGATVCDFGCGTGLLTERLAEVAGSVDAVDTSPAMLAQLAAKVEHRGLANVRPSSVLPATAGAHELVVCSSVLGFVDDHPATVASLTRLLRPDGLLVQWDWERDPEEPDAHGLTRDQTRRALAHAGLTDVEVDTSFEVEVGGDTMRPLLAVGRRPAPGSRGRMPA